MAVSTPPPAPSRSNPSTFSDRMDAFLAWMVTAVPEFNTLATLANGGAYNVVADLLDPTAGRLPLTGWMGLGASAPNLIGDLNNALRAGFYSYAGGAANRPFSIAGTLLVLPSTSARVVQIAAEHNTGRIATRYISDAAPSSGAWTAWREIYHAGTILGTVSQSGGVPTGRVIEAGSNANGEYVRFADGTQICSAALTINAAISAAVVGGYRNTGQTWFFPAAFAAAPRVTGAPAALTSLSIIATSTGATAVSVFHTANASQAAADLVAQMTAVGRWF